MSRRLIRIVTPEPPEARRGNAVTALRWAGFLRELGFEVVVEESLGGGGDLLIALHARRSAGSVARWIHDAEGPVIVALTGTDLYGDLAGGDESARDSVRAASRLIVLQPRAIDALDPAGRDKARVVYQSTVPPEPPPAKAEPFRVCVVGHMRPVKDPFRTAEALACLPAESTVYVVHIGSAPDNGTERRARELMDSEPRYQWLGPLPRPETLIEIARSQLLCLTSVMEGGANVVTEALACNTPVISSNIDGSIGLLGADYPGLFAVGDTTGLAHMLVAAETQPDFYAALVARCRELDQLADPETEREALRSVMTELHFL